MTRARIAALWVIVAISAALAVGAIAALGLEIPRPGGGTKSTLLLLTWPVAALLIALGMAPGARRNLGVDPFAPSLAASGTDTARAAKGFARALLNFGLVLALAILAAEIVSIGRLAGAPAFRSIDPAWVSRGVFVALGLALAWLGNVWPKSAAAAPSAGDPARTWRLRRFRGRVMVLTGLGSAAAALTLPLLLVVAIFFALGLLRVVLFARAGVFDDYPREATGPR